MIRLLHLSDFHYRPVTSRHQLELVESLVRDLRMQFASRPFDIVVFTGDLAFSGVSVEAFAECHDVLLRPCLEAIELTNSQCVLVPGNHDIDISSVDVFGDEGMRRLLANEAAIEQLWTSPGQSRHLTERLAHFYTYIDDHFQGPAAVEPAGLLGRCYGFTTPDGTVTVSAANSAWRATGRKDDEDRGHLLLTERQLQELEAARPPADLQVFACHHTPHWLHPVDADLARSRVQRTYDLALFGHNHLPKPTFGRSALGDLVTSMGGSLFESSGSHNSYSIIDVDLERNIVEVTIRKHVRERNEWDADVDHAKGGRLAMPLRTPSLEAPRDLPPAAVGAADSSLSARAAIADHIALLQAPNFGEDSDPLSTLIEPPMYNLPEYGAEGVGSDARVRVSADDYLAGDSMLLVLGSKETGKTCAASWILAESLQRSGRTPVLVDFQTLDAGPNGLRKAIRHRLMATGIRCSIDLSDAPPLTVALDNFRPDSGRKSDRTLQCIADHPEIRFVITVSTHEPIANIETWLPEGITARRLHIGQYRSREIRALASTLYRDPDSDLETIVSAVVGILVNQGLERTPWTVVMVLLIFRYEPSLVASDVTSLVDKYLDLVLGKWQVLEDGKTAGIDFLNRKHFLMSLASEMHQTGQLALSEDELLNFTTAYLELYGIDIAAKALIDDLLSRHVLAGSPDALGFATGDLRQFFIAVAVQHGELDVDKLMGEEYTDSLDAIVHLAGLTRNQRRVLELVAGRLDEMTSELNDFPLAMFESVEAQAWAGLPDLDKSLAAVRRIGQVAAEAQSPEAEERYHDRLLEAGDEPEPNLDDFDALLRGAVRLYQHAALLSLCLQRSELVPDQAFKVAITVQCVNAWTLVFTTLCALEAELSEEHKEKRDRFLAETGMTDAQVTIFNQLHVFLEIMSSAIGTLAGPKTRRALRSAGGHPDLDRHLVTRLLYAIIITVNEGDKWEDEVRDFVAEFAKSPHVLRIMHMVLTTKYCDRELNHESQALVEAAVLHIVEQQYGRGPDSGRARVDILQALKDARIRAIGKAVNTEPLSN